MLTGLRGVGKTVLLNALRSSAVRAHWGTGKFEARPDQRLRRPLAARRCTRRSASWATRSGERGRPRARHHQVLRPARRARRGAKLRDKWHPGIDAPAVSGRADSGDIEIDLVELLTDIGGLAADVGKGVAIFIDEMQDLDPEDVSALCAACHEISQSGLPVIVVGAGLPHLPAVLSASKSYSREALSLLSASTGCRATPPTWPSSGRPPRRAATFTPEALDEMYAVTAGYPYFIQAYGKVVWDVAPSSPVTAEDIRVAVPEAESELAVGLLRLPLRAGHPGRARVPAGHGRRRPDGSACRSSRPSAEGLTEVTRRHTAAMRVARARGGADVRRRGRAGSQAAVALARPGRPDQEGPDLLRRARPDRLHRAALRPLPAHPVLTVDGLTAAKPLTGRG